MTDEMHAFERRMAAAMTSAMTAASETAMRNVVAEFREHIATIAQDAVNGELRNILEILSRTANSVLEAVEIGRQNGAALATVQSELTKLHEEHDRCCGEAA